MPRKKTVNTTDEQIKNEVKTEDAGKPVEAKAEKAVEAKAEKPVEVKAEKPAKKAPAKKAAPKPEKAVEAKVEKAVEAKVEKPVEVKAEKPAKKAPAKKAAAPKAEKAVEVKAEKAVEVKAEKPAKKTARKPAAKKAEPVMEEVKPVVEEETKPVVEEVKPVVEETKPVVEEVKPVVEDAKPVVEEVKPVVEETKPVIEETKTVVEEVVPVAEEIKSVVEETPAVEPVVEETPVVEAAEPVVESEPVVEEAAPVEETPVSEPEVVEAPSIPAEPMPEPRRSIAFIGSECYPFVKTGGLGDVMYALPKALIKQNCDVKVILPRYKCIPWRFQEKMQYRGAFEMDLCSDGRSFYVGIMEYECDGVVYDFIDNEDFFGYGNPYTNLIDDIPRFCFFSKAALAALNFMNWVPDVIHCHDWQAALVPVYLRTLFAHTAICDAKTMLTIHNLRFQGVYNIPTIKYWSGLPDYVFNKDALTQGWVDANMLKGGLNYCDMITTVSNTYAGEIQTAFYGEGLDAHLRYHSGKLRGIVNGIDVDLWNTATDDKLAVNYDITNVLEKKRANKRALQEQLGLNQDDHVFVIGLISRLTNQKGLDLVNTIIPALIDGHTQVVVLGTGDPQYENSFRYYEDRYRGSVCSNIMYDEGRAHAIYAGADALLVPSLFEPCGLTQLIAMRYGTVPIVRETGGLKDTVQPYNEFTNWGYGFTFDRYDSGLLLDAVNRAKTLYFTNRWRWDEMVQRDMDVDVSWEKSAQQYRALYLELKP